MFEIIGQLLVGWLLADFISGIVHWWLDQASTDIPIIGPRVILANQEHHEDPIDFTHATLWKRNAALWMSVSFVSIIWLIVLGPSWLWLSATVGAASIGEIHVLAHTSKNPGLLLRVLRGTGLIQSSGQHAIHHRLPHKTSFCVITNWLNPMLDGLGFWKLLDQASGKKS